MSDLKPCPFCGGTRLVVENFEQQGFVWDYCRCKSCGARGPVGEDYEEAIKKFNTRTEVKADE